MNSLLSAVSNVMVGNEFGKDQAAIGFSTVFGKGKFYLGIRSQNTGPGIGYGLTTTAVAPNRRSVDDQTCRIIETIDVSRACHTDPVISAGKTLAFVLNNEKIVVDGATRITGSRRR